MTVKTFEQTIVERTSLLHVYARKLTQNPTQAEDLVQDTLLLALRHREKFVNGTSIEAWLYTILRNGFINRYRKQNKWHEVTRNVTIRQQSLQHSNCNHGISWLLMKAVWKNIDLLPATYRKPLKLVMEGYRYHEIAAITGHPLGTVKSQIHQGRNLLKKALRHEID